MKNLKLTSRYGACEFLYAEGSNIYLDIGDKQLKINLKADKLEVEEVVK